MFIDQSIRPEDIPVPPTPSEAVARFAGTLWTLVPQPTVEEAFIAVDSQTQNGDVVLETATVSYTLWRNPADRTDPANEELSDELRSQLEREPVAPLAPWMIEARNRMRFPGLWDAVRTTRLDAPERASEHTLQRALIEHTNYILQNTFRDERTDRGMPPVILGEAIEEAIEYDVPIRIARGDILGARIDTDTHVYAVAAQFDNRILTAVFPRRYLPLFEIAFASHA